MFVNKDEEKHYMNETAQFMPYAYNDVGDSYSTGSTEGFDEKIGENSDCEGATPNAHYGHPEARGHGAGTRGKPSRGHHHYSAAHSFPPPYGPPPPHFHGHGHHGAHSHGFDPFSLPQGPPHGFGEAPFQLPPHHHPFEMSDAFHFPGQMQMEKKRHASKWEKAMIAATAALVGFSVFTMGRLYQDNISFSRHHHRDHPPRFREMNAFDFHHFPPPMEHHKPPHMDRLEGPRVDEFFVRGGKLFFDRKPEENHIMEIEFNHGKHFKGSKHHDGKMGEIHKDGKHDDMQKSAHINEDELKDSDKPLIVGELRFDEENIKSSLENEDNKKEENKEEKSSEPNFKKMGRHHKGENFKKVKGEWNKVKEEWWQKAKEVAKGENAPTFDDIKSEWDRVRFSWWSKVHKLRSAMIEEH